MHSHICNPDNNCVALDKILNTFWNSQNWGLLLQSDPPFIPFDIRRVIESFYFFQRTYMVCAKHIIMPSTVWCIFLMWVSDIEATRVPRKEAKITSLHCKNLRWHFVTLVVSLWCTFQQRKCLLALEFGPADLLSEGNQAWMQSIKSAWYNSTRCIDIIQDYTHKMGRVAAKNSPPLIHGGTGNGAEISLESMWSRKNTNSVACLICAENR